MLIVNDILVCVKKNQGKHDNYSPIYMWCGYLKNQESWERWEGKIVRPISGGVKEAARWRLRTNQSLEALYKEPHVTLENLKEKAG